MASINTSFNYEQWSNSGGGCTRDAITTDKSATFLLLLSSSSCKADSPSSSPTPPPTKAVTATATTKCSQHPTRRIFSISFLLLFAIWFAFPSTGTATVLHKFVDVKGNGALREVRIMYDLYHNGNDNTNSIDPAKVQLPPVTITSAAGGSPREDKLTGNFRAYEVNVPVYPWAVHRPHAQQPAQVHLAAHHAAPLQSSNASPNGSPAESIIGGHYHPQYYLEQGMTRPAVSRPQFYNSKNIASHYLVRGKPLFVEVDFVPKYIPQMTYSVAVSVTLPAHIRGRPWILGWHQEVFPIPTCRLCTNHNQSFTLPVTLFLPDDGWCPEGRVPSIWKIEAIGRESTGSRLMDQTDMIMAYGYDDLRQLYISNDANSTVHCRGINEAIVA